MSILVQGLPLLVAVVVSAACAAAPSEGPAEAAPDAGVFDPLEAMCTGEEDEVDVREDDGGRTLVGSCHLRSARAVDLLNGSLISKIEGDLFVEPFPGSVLFVRITEVREAGSVFIGPTSELPSVEFPALEAASSFTVHDNVYLELFDAPKLRTVTEHLEFSCNQRLPQEAIDRVEGALTSEPAMVDIHDNCLDCCSPE